MLLDLLLIFTTISIVLLILSALVVDDNPELSIVFIFAGLLFVVYCALGYSSIDVVLSDGSLYSDSSTYDAFGWGFLWIGILYIFVFIRGGFNYLRFRAEKMKEQNPRK
jgi:predicted membrane protein